MRYFIEVAYEGTRYAGFQIQKNANTIQAEVEKALGIYTSQNISLTGSSRTDAGVHALQNYFHFDIENPFLDKAIYNLNAMLPRDIAIKSLIPVSANQHCRFDATSREYKYLIYQRKNPFLHGRAWFYPYTVNFEILQKVATLLTEYSDFTSFAKRKSQAATNLCTISKSAWSYEGECVVYNVVANRFLRGMVRGLVGTMMLAGRNKISEAEFVDIILARDVARASFATPAHGLYLVHVAYPFIKS